MQLPQPSNQQLQLLHQKFTKSLCCQGLYTHPVIKNNSDHIISLRSPPTRTPEEQTAFEQKQAMKSVFLQELLYSTIFENSDGKDSNQNEDIKNK
jgi:hypothetical protein